MKIVNNSSFSARMLKLDCVKEIQKIKEALRKSLKMFKKRGIVVALSGGIDSSVVGALCVRAVGRDRVLGLLLPEKESSSETLELGQLVAEYLGISTVCKDITKLLEVVGCYRYRDKAVRSVIKKYDSKCKCKIVLPNVVDGSKYKIFSVVVQSPDGVQIKKRLTLHTYLKIVAATNFKQRVRKMLEYYHADCLNYAVVGTPNRQEYDQGFFVKLGDGAADIKPIAHLYKTQVYQMAEFLQIPEEVRKRSPTTDTYPLLQNQEEFFFSIRYEKRDICLYGKNHRIPLEDVAVVAKMSIEQVKYIYHDIEAKRNVARYLNMPAILVEDVSRIVY